MDDKIHQGHRERMRRKLFDMPDSFKRSRNIRNYFVRRHSAQKYECDSACTSADVRIFGGSIARFPCRTRRNRRNGAAFGSSFHKRFMRFINESTNRKKKYPDASPTIRFETV